VASGGFRVDLAALEAAAAGVDGILDQVSIAPLSSVTQNPASFGNQTAASAVSGFVGAWQRGITNLLTAGGQFTVGLTANVAFYQRVEDDLRAHIQRVHGELVGSGLDPEVWR
jgi:hypothetical protein